MSRTSHPLEERRERMDRKLKTIMGKMPEGLNRNERWAWAYGDRDTKSLLKCTLEIRQALEKCERLRRSYDPDLAKEQYPLYIRFGAIPGGGRSFTGHRMVAEINIPGLLGLEYPEEIGVSCFRARSLGQDTDDDRTGYEVLLESVRASRTSYGVLKAQRTAYLVTGEEVGRGGDEEPLLKNAQIVGRVEAEDLEFHGPGEPLLDAVGAVEYIEDRSDVEFGGILDPEAARISSALAGELPILEEVLAHSTGKNSVLHGPAHWQRVCAAGLMLCERDERADPLLVFLFSIFHDSMRETDGQDPGHGDRGARLARELLEGRLEEERLALLESACALHTAGQTSTDPTIGACWDADRLNLWRVGIEPAVFLLSTEAAPGLIERAKEMQEEAYTWDGLVAWFAERFASTELWE